MAGAKRHDDAVITALAAQPRRFAFFQAVRLLEAAQLRLRRGTNAPAGRGALGENAQPSAEPAIFAASPRLGFPRSEIESVDAAPDQKARPRLTISFLGLVGAAGVLPAHYSELVLTRRRRRDNTLIGFVDIFHHRLISLFYRAWRKYRLPLSRELAETPAQDKGGMAVRALLGLNAAHLAQRLSLPDDDVMGFAQLLARRVKSVASLRTGLEHLLVLPVQVVEFQPGWIGIAPQEQTRLSGQARNSGRFAQLGQGAVLGESVWDAQSRFRIRIGPLDYPQFRRFFEPGGSSAALPDFVRLFAGPAVDFDVQLILKRRQIPPLKIGQDGARLGYDSWLDGQTLLADAPDCVLNLTRAGVSERPSTNSGRTEPESV